MKNEAFIKNEMQWLNEVIITRLNEYFNKTNKFESIFDITPQTPTSDDGAYANFLLNENADFGDRLYLALSIVPFLKPQILDCLFLKNTSTGSRFVEFGGLVDDSGHLIPSLTTFLFIMSGGDISERLILQKQYLNHKLFHSAQFLHNYVGSSRDFLLQPSEELLCRLVWDCEFTPEFTSNFPAKRITTSRQWNDLVLDQNTMEQIDVIKKWLMYKDILSNEWKMADKLKKGFRVLFAGPSGTGKTFTASLLGKETGMPVYCVDLSVVISKYIGETEKNLSKIFDIAEGKNWILFFDEADALFGKRTNLKDSHDKFANQEVAFLLQRIEDYNGLVILSTNLKSNIDDAFARRFQSVIQFRMPDSEQRKSLWTCSFSPYALYDNDVDFNEIAYNYELSGGSILNVVQYCSLMAISRSSNTIELKDIIQGIKAEYLKQGKLI